LLSLVNARFAWAQAAIQEPGAYAFYHPDGDVLHAGSGVQGARGVPDSMALIRGDGFARVDGTTPRRHRLSGHR
jgi:hypothetical protein